MTKCPFCGSGQFDCKFDTDKSLYKCGAVRKGILWGRSPMCRLREFDRQKHKETRGNNE